MDHHVSSTAETSRHASPPASLRALAEGLALSIGRGCVDQACGELIAGQPAFTHLRLRLGHMKLCHTARKVISLQLCGAEDRSCTLLTWAWSLPCSVEFIFQALSETMVVSLGNLLVPGYKALSMRPLAHYADSSCASLLLTLSPLAPSPHYDVTKRSLLLASVLCDSHHASSPCPLSDDSCISSSSSADAANSPYLHTWSGLDCARPANLGAVHRQ